VNTTDEEVEAALRDATPDDAPGAPAP